MGAISDAVAALGKVVDTVFPFFVGNRTKAAAVTAAATPALGQILAVLGPLLMSAIPQAGPILAALPTMLNAVSAIATTLIPVFAAAGLVRPVAAPLAK